VSHFSNVKVLTDLATGYDMQAIVDMIEDSDAEELADDIAYVIITLFADLSEFEKKKVCNLLLTEISNHDFKAITYGQDNSGDISGDESPPI